jgi:imidazole glycerol phosphate synthase subunit HisF
MTLARRLCALLTVDEEGRLVGRYRHLGAFDVAFAEQAAAFMADDGVDEIWLRIRTPTSKGPAALYAALATLEKRTFVPVVAWAPVASAADVRLLLGFGADRVVVDVSRGLPDPLTFVSRIVDATGPDRVCCAMPVQRRAIDGGVGFELVDGGHIKDGSMFATAQSASIIGRDGGTGIDAVALASKLPDAGAAEVLLLTARPQAGDRRLHDGELIEKVSATLTCPLLSFADDKEPSDLATPLLMGADGVVTSLLSSGLPTATDVQRALTEYGIPVRMR